MKPITLSQEARRRFGAGYIPTPRHPDAPLPPDMDLMKRDELKPSDLGRPQYIRPGADAVYPSRVPFSKDAT